MDMGMDRVLGMVYGAVYGDVLGTPHEFRKDQIHPEELIMCPLRRFNRYTKQYSSTVAGQYSDDTEMAITLLRYLIKNGWTNYRPHEVVLEYQKWANSGTKFIGRNTRELLKGVTTVKGYQTRFNKKFATPELSEQAQSNGALMRAYPFALVGLKKDIDLAISMATLDCRLTNPSSVAVETECRYLRSLMRALKGDSIDQIIGDYAFNSPPPNVRQNKGLCTHGLYCSYWSLKNFKSYQDAIKQVILLGGDTDTNASIAGALLGAYYGFKKMCENPEFTEHLGVIMSRRIDQGDYQRPPEWGPAVIDQLLVGVRSTPIPPLGGQSPQ
jgi:ADP-ribosyl-[dinitrogen reductase] hydrolase